MGRTLLAALAGLATAFITIWLVEFAGHALYPPPPGIDPANTAASELLAGCATALSCPPASDGAERAPSSR